VFGILFLTSISFSGGKIRRDRSFYFLVCLFVWQCLELLYYLASDTGFHDLLSSVRIIPISFLPVAFFHHVAAFYHIKRKIPRWVYLALLGIPSAIAVLSFIPATSTGRSIGLVYYLEMSFSYAVFVLVGVIIIAMCLRLPGAYRRGSTLHLILLFFLITSKLLDATADFAFDVRYFGLCLCGLLFYCAHLLNNDASNISIDKGSIFDFLDQAIFILNENGIIVELNRPALQWLSSLGRSFENVAFDGLLSVMSNNNRVIVKKLEDSNDSDIHVVNSAIPLIYRMERRAFTIKDGVGKGEFVTLTDVTPNRLIIDRLRDMAGVDTLTGASNRYRYQDLLRKLDCSDYYPLAIVIGDVNGLKTINDTYGHQTGDQYIKDIAASLMSCCPRDGHVVRYGGDEFATLLVNTSADAVESYIEKVGKALSEQKTADYSYKPSIALGYAIKHHGNENLNTLVGQADQKMYADKVARKNAEREALNNA
jgi:diguanylate cyclase (GGDEF)-like protein